MSHKIIIQKNKLMKLYILDNLSSEEISKIYKCSKSTILNWIRRFDLGKFIKRGFKRGRENLKIRGDNHPTKRPEVQQKMRDNHWDCRGNKNPNFGQGYKIEGNKNPNWLGGISNNGYNWKFNDILKSKIRKRDNYACQNCGMTEEQHIEEYYEKLHIHHIDYNKDNCKKSNLIALCLKCNIKANYNRKYWMKYFKKGI